MGFNNSIKESIVRLMSSIRPYSEQLPSGKLVNIENDSILLVFNYSTKQDLNRIITLVKNAREYLKNISVLAFNKKGDKIITKSDGDLLLVSLYDFNLIGKGKKRLANWLEDHSFGILISFFDKSDSFYDNIISSISSEFKSGIYHAKNVNLFDLTISQKEKDYNKQLEIFLHYINTLNING